ncbi:MAG: spore coat protein [Peptostreptococcaceae bacterium]
MVNLSTKERLLLQDEKEQEQLCVDKYTDYSSKANDPELKQLFSQLAQKEQEHLNSINQLLTGVVPNINAQQGQQNQQNPMQQQANFQPQFMQEPSINFGMPNTYDTHDKMLCTDSLSTEKFVSSTYNTAIFEFRDKNIRQVLNHIQKEEQEHGEKIYNYMASHGMYQVQ